MPTALDDVDIVDLCLEVAVHDHQISTATISMPLMNMDMVVTGDQAGVWPVSFVTIKGIL